MHHALTIHEWSLVGVKANIIAWAVLVISVAAVFVLIPASRRRMYLTRGAPLALLGTAAFLGVARLTEAYWWKLPHPLHLHMYAEVGAALMIASLVLARGCMAAVAGLAGLRGRTDAGHQDEPGSLAPRRAAGTPRRGGFFVWGRRVATVLLLIFALIGGMFFTATQINRDFVAYSTVGALIGQLNTREISAEEATRKVGEAFTGLPLLGHWKPNGKLPESGALTTVDIPGTESGLKMRPAKLYLPPAYFATPRPALPILVIMVGQPGGMDDWVNYGRVVETMNAFAAAHNGLAPVVLHVDATGSVWGNLLCVDSPLGRADTYLSRDVPAWIAAHLQVTDDHRRWVIGGLSLGGTCSLQLATAHPDVYGVFVDLSGEREPTLGSHAETVSKVYGGDEAAYQEASPINRLRSRRYPELSGMFVVGKDDKESRPGIEELHKAAKAAGVDAHLTLVPGKHDWGVWATGLRTVTPWLAQKTGITP